MANVTNPLTRFLTLCVPLLAWFLYNTPFHFWKATKPDIYTLVVTYMALYMVVRYQILKEAHVAYVIVFAIIVTIIVGYVLCVHVTPKVSALLKASPALQVFAFLFLVFSLNFLCITFLKSIQIILYALVSGVAVYFVLDGSKTATGSVISSPYQPNPLLSTIYITYLVWVFMWVMAGQTFS